MVTKALTSITTEEYRSFICNKVVPAIAEKWPDCHRNMTIKIQQDNAPVHIKETDVAFHQAVAATDLNIQLRFQPSNSPDLNVLDLGFFNAIQSLQQESACATIDELVEATETAFQSLQWKKLNNVFLTLQKVMECCLLHAGNNNYKLPHILKQKLERNGELPVSIVVSDELSEIVAEYVG